MYDFKHHFKFTIKNDEERLYCAPNDFTEHAFIDGDEIRNQRLSDHPQQAALSKRK